MRYLTFLLLAAVPATLHGQSAPSASASFGLGDDARPGVDALTLVREPPFAALRGSAPQVFRLVLISTTGEDAVIRFQKDSLGASVVIKRFRGQLPHGPYVAAGTIRRPLPLDRLEYIAATFDYMHFYATSPETTCSLDGDWYLLEATTPEGDRALVSSSCDRTAKILADLLAYEAAKALAAQ